MDSGDGALCVHLDTDLGGYLLRAVTETDGLRFKPDAAGRPTRVVVDLDGEAFAETWIEAVEAAQGPR